MISVRLRRLGVLAVTAVAVTALALPASADTPPSSACVVDTPTAGAPATDQPLKVCASFDQSAYRSSELIKLTLVVTNLGKATATGVGLSLGTLSGNYAPYGNMTGLFSPPGLNIPAGDTAASTFSGYEYDPTVGSVSLDQNIAQSRRTYGAPIDVSASVIPVVSNYSGVVYVDANGNGVPDPGEGLAGVTVTLIGPFGGVKNIASTVNQTTGSDGSFDFANLPGGLYYVEAAPPAGRVINWPASGNALFMVDGSADDTGVAIPATAPLSDTLTATAAFDQSSYHVGDPANITFTLKNTGTTAISGIQASCDHSGNFETLAGTGQGWSGLDGPGIDLAPGATTTVHETELVPPDVLNSGSDNVVIDCYFGPNAANTVNGYPEASASAAATASTRPTVTFTVQLVDDNPVAGQPDDGITLLDRTTQDPIDQQLFPTADSGALFVGIPDGTYTLQLGPGWRAAPGYSSMLDTATIPPSGTVVLPVLPVTPLPR